MTAKMTKAEVKAIAKANRLERNQLRDLGLSKRQIQAVRSGQMTEAEAIANPRGGIPGHIPADPNSNRSRRKEAEAERLGARDVLEFETDIGDFPDDPRSLEAWEWMLEHGGRDARRRAVLKAAEMDALETSEEVISGAKIIMRQWAERGWLK